MPIATASAEPQRFDLKTLPDAYVCIRRMTHGEKIHRQGLVNKAKFSHKRGTRDTSIEMEIINEHVTLYTWAKVITEHNLEYLTNSSDPTSAARLDFSKPEHVRMVDGQVAEEINTHIDSIVNFEEVDDGEVGN